MSYSGHNPRRISRLSAVGWLLSVLILPSVGLAFALGPGDPTRPPAWDRPPATQESDDDAPIDTVIVRFDSELPPAQWEGESPLQALSDRSLSALERLDPKAIRIVCGGRLGLVQLRSPTQVGAALETLRAIPEIRYAVPDKPVSLAELVPDDPQFGSQWPLGNAQDVDINATLAWEVTTGSENTVVAVLDSGIDTGHPDLYLAVALNNAEIPPALMAQLVDTNSNGRIEFHDLNHVDNQSLVTDVNGNGFIDAGDLLAPPWSDGVDDDANGYVDDLSGWDSLTEDNNPWDTHGHGTHIAGILGARGNNGIGVAGVDWQTQILPERFHNGFGGSVAKLLISIDHAVLLGADVINSSFGTFSDSQPMKDAIAWAGENDVVWVAAAGNHAKNIDSAMFLYYPSAYAELTNLISVASVDPSGDLSDFSNYGLTGVDLAAPGRDVLSVEASGSYDLRTGTSMAAPHVAGVVALLVGLHPDESPEWYVDRVLATVKPLPDLDGVTLSGGMLDAFLAVQTPNAAGPRIVGVHPAGEIPTTTDRVVVTFDQPINAATFGAEDVGIVGPGGPVVPLGVNGLTDFVFEISIAEQIELGAYTVQVGPQIEDNLGRVMDQDGDATIGEPVEDQFESTFQQVAPPQIWILDDEEPGYTATPGWSNFSGNGLQGDFDFKSVDSGLETATWTFTGLPPGEYSVSATWAPFSNRTVDAPYSVLDEGITELATVTVNQQQAPADFFETVWWQELGGPYTITSGTLAVRLSDLGTPPASIVVADGVRLQKVADTCGPPPAGVPQLNPLSKTGPLLSWAAVTGATGYDVLRGELALLQSTLGDFSQGTDSCLGSDIADTFLDDTDVPPLSTGYWYLVRPRNCGGSGSYDSDGNSQHEPRDAEADASRQSCP